MDGGYYAIKGFEYQVDQTILRLLESFDENEDIYLERIQDINTDSYVIQVKYKETQIFTPSLIKNPVKQLIEEFRKDPSKEYLLYCHFKDLNGYDANVSLEAILGAEKNNYSADDKIQFKNKFKLVFAPNFQDQFGEIIQKLQVMKIASNSDEAIIHYSNIVDYLRKLVIHNPPGNEENRKCNKKQILNLISNNRRIIFNSSLLEYHGRIKYYQHIKRKFTKPRKNRDNLIIIGKVSEATTLKVEEFISQIVHKHFHRATYDIKPLIVAIDDDYIARVKEYLIQHEILFNDGFESIFFNEKIFFQAPVINKKVSGGRATDSLAKISFKLRLISKSTYRGISNHIIVPSYCYIFDSLQEEPFDDVSTISIDKLDTSEILKLFS